MAVGVKLVEEGGVGGRGRPGIAIGGIGSEGDFVAGTHVVSGNGEFRIDAVCVDAVPGDALFGTDYLHVVFAGVVIGQNA